MSEWGGFIYACTTPLPTSYYRPEKEPTSNSSHQRSNSTSRASNRSRRPFRHTRTSSGSQASRSSHESSSLHSSNSRNSPAVSTVGDVRHAHQSTVVSSDLPTPTPSPLTPTSPRPLNFNTSLLGSSLFSSKAVSGERSWTPTRRLRHHEAPHSVDLKNVAMYSEFEATNKPISGVTKQMIIPTTRAESISSTSATTTLSSRTMTSTDPSNSSDNPNSSRPFILRNGRTYINDPTLQYPLPSDLTELHRQCLRTLLQIQVYGGPVCSAYLRANPPSRVLEIGCGSGFWSVTCHKYFKDRGHTDITFTGIDIAPLAPGNATTPADACKLDKDMNWKFVHHDLRQLPWPLASEEYDLIMVKDTCLLIPNMMYASFMEEYIRLLKPGGTLEMWESDATIRMLRPHVPSPGPGSDDAEEHEEALGMGAYIMTPNTPLSAPLNTFLVDYNTWLSRALENRTLTAVPCTLIGPFLVQESEVLMDVKQKRLAIPLSELRWEREGVGGVVTKGGRSYVEMKGKAQPHHKVKKQTLTAGQSALRKTALLTVVQQIQAMEPMLREQSGKSQDEWDLWLGKMMGDLMGEGGTSWGECLELGAWWARKKPRTSD